MAKCTLSKQAAADFDAIAEYSLQHWGISRAEAYISELQAALQRVAQFPGIGRDACHVRAGYRVINVGAHCVFYRPSAEGVLIIRLLHERMDFTRHF